MASTAKQLALLENWAWLPVDCVAMGTRRVADDDTFDMDTPVDCTVEVDTEEEEPRVALHHTWDTSLTLTSTCTWVGDCWNTDVMPRVGGTASEHTPACEEGEHAHTHAQRAQHTRPRPVHAYGRTHSKRPARDLASHVAFGISQAAHSDTRAGGACEAKRHRRGANCGSHAVVLDVGGRKLAHGRSVGRHDAVQLPLFVGRVGDGRKGRRLLGTRWNRQLWRVGVWWVADKTT